jgi:hypothetical protein
MLVASEQIFDLTLGCLAQSACYSIRTMVKADVVPSGLFRIDVRSKTALPRRMKQRKPGNGVDESDRQQQLKE